MPGGASRGDPDAGSAGHHDAGHQGHAEPRLDELSTASIAAVDGERRHEAGLGESLQGGVAQVSPPGTSPGRSRRSVIRSSPVADAAGTGSTEATTRLSRRIEVGAQSGVDALLRHDDQGQVQVAAGRSRTGSGAALLDPQVDGGVSPGTDAAPAGRATWRAGVAPSRTRPRRNPTSSCTSRWAVSTSSEDPLGQRQQHLAGRGEADVACRSNSGAPSRPQGVNLLTQRRLGYADDVGRLGEMSYFCDRDESTSADGVAST
jgi:hypothetical protein